MSVIRMVSWCVVFAVVGTNVNAHAASDQTPPEIHHEPVKQVFLHQPSTFRAEIKDEHGVFAPALYVRIEGEKNFQSFPMQPVPGQDGWFQVELPKERVTGTLEYFVEAFDQEGNGPSRVGSPDAPYRAVAKAQEVNLSPRETSLNVVTSPSVEESDPVTEKWWFWTVTAVVVGGGVLTYFLLKGDDAPKSVTLEVKGPSLVEAL